MSKRDHYLLSIRNKAIRQTFYDHLARGIPTMQAYALTAKQFYLSEGSVRNIIAKMTSKK